MITLTAALIVIVAVLAFTLFVRDRDLPEVEPPSPFEHLDQRKAQIYDNLRDLQFEFRVGKLSEADYQRTKQGLQRELAIVMAEIDKIKQGGSATVPPAEKAKATAAPAAPSPASPAAAGTVCPHCGATFPQPLKFCGECGKPMEAGA